ncbi:hypothetical protein JCM3775_003520 [Rhodotorula graminis]|uniref:FAD/NAD(P)-binding domain-containing protein n=1 Tax=Rhodotorula graminis (strain WP1) TaxID=578459 RepID=A0A0P9FCX3_RHOGW|nr:uncharacterized protein RHOBADRAFT_54772 [Rhodotorula graminis WP1]KPV73566.1 hypothetical protein RHOBADRAFT_54772 [Rhodotorula graminis WP1]
MPASSSSSSSRTVVVVGYGPAAVPAVQTLAAQLPADWRLVVVSATTAYWPVSALRAAIVSGWEDKPVASVEHAFPHGKRHVLVTGTQVVELREHSVLVDKPHPELGCEIAFDYCILATGSKYAYPCRPRVGATVEEAVADLRQTQRDVAAAESVLIIGGGPVGVELAGEIGEYYGGSHGRPKKRVTLVHSHDRFIHQDGWSDKFNKSLKSQVEALGTKVVFNAKVSDGPTESGPVEGGSHTFHLDNGETVDADFVFVAFGSSPNTGFVGEFDPATLNDKRQVKVRPSFQLDKYPTLFAIGDITAVDESKLFAHAKNHGAVAAANIIALIRAGNSASSTTPPKSYKAGPQLMIVSVGTKGGAGQLFGFTVGNWFSSFVKSKSLFVSDFKKMYAATA